LQFVTEQYKDGSKCKANITDLTPDLGVLTWLGV
jgi:hypothetical protein